MKRILLFIAACCFWLVTSNAQVERKVMIEQFTNASCGPCAAQNPAFNALLTPNEDRVIALKYQWYFPGFDPMNAQNPTEPDTRIRYYGISGVPTAVIDGTIPNNNYGGGLSSFPYNGAPAGFNQAILDYAKGRMTNIDIELDHYINVTLDTIWINCTVKNLGSTAFTPSDGRLHIAITEERIEFIAAPGSNGEREFSHVMRKMVPDVAGTSISSIPANDEINVSFAYPLPDYIYGYDELGVVAFVQDNSTKEMFQAARSVKKDLPLGGAYVRAALEDRTVTSETPCEQTVNPKVLVRNNFSTVLDSFTVSYILNGAAPVSKKWQGTLRQDELVVVNFGDVPLQDEGSYGIAYSISDFNDDPNIINIERTASVTVPSAVSSLSSDVIGSSVAYEFENDPTSTFPANSVANNIFSIANTFRAVDADIVNSNSPVGGYGQSDKAMVLDFYNWSPQSTGTLQATLTLAKVDLTGFDKAFFKMDRAYAPFPGRIDRLQILVSTNCGKNWSIVATRAGGSLSTAPSTQAEFVPSANEWETDIIDISDYVDQQIQIGIRAISAYGNSAYLDNIEVYGENATSTANVNLLNGKVNVFPNPVAAGAEVVVEFDLVQSTEVDIEVYDLSGKLITTLAKGKSFGAGKQVSTWSDIEQSGLYLVKVKTNYGELTQKLTVF